MTFRLSYEELQEHVKDAEDLYIDGNNYKRMGKKLYTYIFESREFAFYKFELGQLLRRIIF